VAFRFPSFGVDETPISAWLILGLLEEGWLMVGDGTRTPRKKLFLNDETSLTCLIS
jgi:hypothetical protein